MGIRTTSPATSQLRRIKTVMFDLFYFSLRISLTGASSVKIYH